MLMAKDKTMFRAYAPGTEVRLIKVLAEIKQTSLSDILAEALKDWLSKPENQELIKKHNLNG